MEKSFTEGFIYDMGDLLGICTENNTDGIQIEMEIENHVLVIDINFSIVKTNTKENKNDN